MGSFRSGIMVLTLFAVVGCGDSVTGPIVLSVSDIRGMMNEIAEALDDTESPFYLHEAAAFAPVRLSLTGAPPVSYTGEADCPQGGRVSNSGSGDESEAAIAITFVQTFEDCQTANYTVSGTHDVTVDGTDDGTTLVVDMDLTGQLTVEASGDRHGTCDLAYGYTITITDVAVSFETRGTICGEDIKRVTGTPVSY